MDGSMTRLDALRAKLAGRLDHEGKPKHGYAENVALIKAEIARLEGNANG